MNDSNDTRCWCNSPIDGTDLFCSEEISRRFDALSFRSEKSTQTKCTFLYWVCEIGPWVIVTFRPALSIVEFPYGQLPHLVDVSPADSSHAKSKIFCHLFSFLIRVYHLPSVKMLHSSHNLPVNLWWTSRVNDHELGFHIFYWVKSRTTVQLNKCFSDRPCRTIRCSLICLCQNNIWSDVACRV